MESNEKVIDTLKIKMEEHYRKSVRNYFADQTEEGMIAKYARVREDENILKKLFCESEMEIAQIYIDEYRIKYGSEGGK